MTATFVCCLLYRGCDCYILKDILENWSDEDASTILSNLYKIINKNSRVLIIERVMHTGSYSEEKVESNNE